MINFDLEKKSKWFYFIEENPEFGSICLCLPDSEDWDEIKRLTVKKGKPDYHRGVRYETETTNEKLSEKLSVRKFIVDWKGISIKGTPVDCTNENKERLSKDPNFRKFVGECIGKLIDDDKIFEEARVKNSESSADGDSQQ